VSNLEIGLDRENITQTGNLLSGNFSHFGNLDLRSNSAASAIKTRDPLAAEALVAVSLNNPLTDIARASNMTDKVKPSQA